MTVRPQRSGDAVRRAAPVALLLSGLCLAAGVVAAGVLRDEWRATIIAQAVAERSATARDLMLETYGDLPPAEMSPRAAVPLVQLALNAARLGASPALRALDAERADGLIRYLQKERPGDAATLLLRAQNTLLRSGDAGPLACSAFAASYRERPFYPDAAVWRIAFARLYWQRLDPETRRAAIEEAVWQTRFDGGQRSGMERLLGDSPAGVAYQLRMAAVDHGVG